jgi:hypothetical protein
MPFRSALIQTITGTLLSFCLGTSLAADEFRAFGHEVQTLTTNDGDVLKVGGREMHRNRYISFDEYAVIDGVGVIIGSSSGGGNACDSSPFVISFQPGEDPRFDGPLDACVGVTSSVGKNEINFETKPFAGHPGQKWRWTLDKGIEATGTVEHVASPASGWTALRTRKIRHPNDLLDYKDFADLLKQMAGKDWEEFPRMTTGPGTIEHAGEIVVAEVCQAHACNDQGLLVVADPSKRTLYAAWKLRDRKIAVSPAIGGWPERAKVEIRRWAKAWTSP